MFFARAQRLARSRHLVEDNAEFSDGFCALWRGFGMLNRRLLTHDVWSEGVVFIPAQSSESVGLFVQGGPGAACVLRARLLLKNAVGLVIQWSSDEATAVYWLLCSMIERPVAQKRDGTLIYSVRDAGKPVGNGVRADVTNVEQIFHPDNACKL